jgi:hypothetical protein
MGTGQFPGHVLLGCWLTATSTFNSRSHALASFNKGLFDFRIAVGGLSIYGYGLVFKGPYIFWLL